MLPIPSGHAAQAPDTRRGPVGAAPATVPAAAPAAAVVVAAPSRSVPSASRLREELIATVSHELRTPLTSIMGYTEILVDLGEPVVSKEALRILSIVRRNAERQLKVVEDLLMLTVLSGGVGVDRIPTDLGQVLHSVLAEVDSLAAVAGVAVVPGGLRSVPVLGDPVRLREVLACLVNSAVRFSRHGGRVEVRLLVESDHGVIEVRDQGGGTAPAGEGALAGLGGPVLRGIVEAHAGHLGVDHDPDGATTVRVRLPLAG